MFIVFIKHVIEITA